MKLGALVLIGMAVLAVVFGFIPPSVLDFHGRRLEFYEMVSPMKAGIIDFILAIVLMMALLSGCAPTGMRKVTAWGIWAVVMGSPIGIGYWHSEHGVGVESEESAKPEMPNVRTPNR